MHYNHSPTVYCIAHNTLNAVLHYNHSPTVYCIAHNTLNAVLHYNHSPTVYCIAHNTLNVVMHYNHSPFRVPKHYFNPIDNINKTIILHSCHKPVPFDYLKIKIFFSLFYSYLT